MKTNEYVEGTMCLCDDDYYQKVLLPEQPFYREGMTLYEAKREIEYINENIEAFFAGTYKPLWRQ